MESCQRDPISKKGCKEDPGTAGCQPEPGARKGYGADRPEEIAQRVWDSRGIRNSQRGLVKGRACLTNLISFCDGGTAWGVRERLLMWSASASAKPSTLCAMVFWRCCSLWPAQLHCVLGKELAGGPGLREGRSCCTQLR